MRILFFVLLLGISYDLHAQEGLTIKGTVKTSSSKLILQGAVLLIKRNEKVLARSTSNKNGEYVFTGLNAGRVLLIANYLGFKSDTQHIELKSDTTVDLNLANSVHELAEVKVRSSVTPVTVRNDTLSFNTNAYKTRAHATLEELLKMLPGVKIDEAGNVTMNGQKIDNITIDGKSYSITDLRMMTHNIPADMISRVEVFDSQTEENKRAGIVSMSQSKTIDLKLKDDKKNGFTGKAYIGVGAGDDYSAGGSLLRLDPKKLFSLQVNSNNINNQFTGPDGSLGSVGAGKQDSQGLTFFTGYPINKKLSLTVNVLYNYSKTNEQNTADRQTYLTDSSLLSHNTGSNINKNSALAAFTSLIYKASANTSLTYSLSYTPSNNSQKTQDSTLLNVQKNGTTYLSSNGLTNNNNQQTNNVIRNSLSLSQKFNKKGRSMMISMSQSLAKQNQETDIYTSVQSFQPPSLQIVNQQVFNPVKTNGYNANVVYQEPLGKKLKLISMYLFNTSQSKLLKTTNDFDAASGLYDLTDTLNSSHFISTITSHTLRTDITNAGEGAKVNYSFGVGGQSYDQHNNNITAALDLGHIYYNFQPDAMLSASLKDNRLLRLFYSGNSGNPTLDQLQPLPDLSNPYLLKLGNPNLRQSFTQQLQTSYSSYNADGRNLQISLGADLTRHQISSATTTLDGGVQQIQFINLDGVYHLNATINYSFPLFSPENGTGSIEGRLNYNHDHNTINGADNIIQGKGALGGFILNFHKGNTLFVDCEGSLQYLDNRYSLNRTQSESWQQDYNINTTCIFPFGITAGFTYGLQLRSTGDLPAQHAGLINAYLSKDILANKAGQLRLSGFNLLDAASSINQAVGQNYIETTQTNRLHRLILLSFIYNFEKFQKGG